MTITRRIATSLSALLLLVALAVAVSAWASARKTASLESMRQAIGVRRQLTDLRHAVLDRAREVSILANVSLTPAQHTDLQARLDDLQLAARALDRRSGGLDAEPDALGTRVDAFAQRARAVFRSLVAGDESGAAIEATAARAIADEFLVIAEGRIREEDLRVREASERFISVTETADRLSLATLVSSLVGALLLAATAAVPIGRGFAELRRGTDALAAGADGVRVGESGDGEFRDLARSFNAMAGRLERALADARDARGRAEQASVAKSAFLCNMSHELRTPLTAITGFASMVESTALAKGDEQIASDAAEIRTAADLLITLVSQIVDLARLERAQMPVQCLEVSLPEIVESVLHLMRPLAARNDNRLTCRFVTPPGDVVTDGVKVKQILMNLLGNACKFTVRGQIAVEVDRRCDADTDCIVLTVADTGVGLTPEQASRIFEEFEQAEPATERAYGGSGLGLAITRGLCELLGGHIAVVSVPGGGTTFVVTLPATPLAAEFPDARDVRRSA